MKKTTKPCEAPTAESGYNGGSFDHTLPGGQIVRADSEIDLFEVWREQLASIRKEAAELIEGIDKCYIREAERYRKLAEKRGRIRVVWGNGPLDVCFTPKEGRS